MATAKRKTSAKRAVKSAKKIQTKAANAAANVARSTAKETNAWVQRGANEWQNGANEWAKQSAKMYQLPFANGDVNEAAQQAAATMKSATENMVRQSSDMMQKMFGGNDPMAQWKEMFQNMPQWGQSFSQFGGAEAAADKLRSMSRESSEQAARAAQTGQAALGEAVALSRENAEALVECTNIAVTVSKELSAELIAFANKSFSQNVELSKQMLTCRTLNDLFDLSSKVAKTNLDAFFSESVKLSELLFQSATEMSEPLNERVSETSERLSKVLAA